MTKDLLRRQIRKALKTYSPGEVQTQSQQLVQLIENLPEIKSHLIKDVAVFATIKDMEPDTSKIIEMLDSLDIDVYVPKCYPLKSKLKSNTSSSSLETTSSFSSMNSIESNISMMEMVRLIDKANEKIKSSLDHFHELNFNKWGIREHHHKVLEDKSKLALIDTNPLNSKLDVIFVPGLAFDYNCNRLGHGRGYYDIYLNRCKQWHLKHGFKPPLTIGLCLRNQLLSEDQLIPVNEFDIPLDMVIHPEGVIRKDDIAE